MLTSEELYCKKDEKLAQTDTRFLIVLHALCECMLTSSEKYSWLSRCSLVYYLNFTDRDPLRDRLSRCFSCH